jgi:hypothetical protein
VAYLLKARVVEPAETAVAMERLCKQTPVARQWLGDRHAIAATVAHARIAELLEAMFSVRLYNSIRDTPIFSSERMLHKAYDFKGSVEKKKTLVMILKRLGTKTN